MSIKRFAKWLTLCLLGAALCLALCSCGNSTKKGTEGLEYAAWDGSYIVTGYYGSDVHVVIPDTHNGIPVTEIEEYVFAETDIQSVYIGANVTTIGCGAFADASLLKEVYISAAVEELPGSDVRDGVFEDCISLEKVTFEKGSVLWMIGRSAFSNCESLKEITLPDNLRNISDYAFSRCTSLKQLTIPATVELVGSGAFANFTQDQEIVIEGSTENWTIAGSLADVTWRGWNYACDAKIVYGAGDVEENIEKTNRKFENKITEGTAGLVYETLKDGTYMVWNYEGTQTHVVIPDTHNGKPVTRINGSAFWVQNSTIESVTIGNNVTSIGPSAFANCKALKEVYIASSVEIIDDSAFKDCTELVKVVFAKGSKLDTLDVGAFYFCTSLQEINLPNSLKTIGNGTFTKCSSLKEISIPKTVERIESYAFGGCKAIESLVIPKNVEYVGAGAFFGFTEEQEIIIKGSTDGWQTETEEEKAWDEYCEAQIINK